MIESAERVYLDHNATSPLRPEARDAMTEILGAPSGNASSLHEEGRAAREVIERARGEVARLVECQARDVVFTSGGSESVVGGIRGVCDRAPKELRRIVVSAIEHSAVLEAVRLAARHGFVVVRVPCGAEGRVHADRFMVNLGDDVALAVLQWANNETGVVQPVEQIGRACREAGIPCLVDAVQAAGKLELERWQSFADLLALSAHKLGGPQGAGALIVREGLALSPLIAGGAQERRRRGGTEAVATLAGFGAAAGAARAGLKRESALMLRLRAKIETRLRELFPQIRFHGQAAPRLPNTVNFAIPGVPGEVLAIALDLEGFAVSTGSACSSGAVEPSHVILAMGFNEDEARAAVRVSVGWDTTFAEVDRFLAAMPRVVERVVEGLSKAV